MSVRLVKSPPPPTHKQSIPVPTSPYVDSPDDLTHHALFLESQAQALTDETHRLGSEINNLEAEYTFLEAQIEYTYQDFKNKEEDLEEEIAELEFDACYLKNKVQGLRLKTTLMENLTKNAQSTYFDLLEKIREAEERLKEKHKMLKATDEDIELALRLAHNATNYCDGITCLNCAKEALECLSMVDASTQTNDGPVYADVFTQTKYCTHGDHIPGKNQPGSVATIEKLSVENSTYLNDEKKGKFSNDAVIPILDRLNNLLQGSIMEGLAALDALVPKLCDGNTISSLRLHRQIICPICSYNCMNLSLGI
jgi:copper chaperone CopZ